jgi:hypothetical protein
MANSVRFLSITHRGPADLYGLEPAPSVTDWEEIAVGLAGAPTIVTGDVLREGVHAIHGNYRGWIMWLYPNVRFYRNAPKSSGGNGYAGTPIPGTKENVTLRMDDVIYEAEIEFV